VDSGAAARAPSRPVAWFGRLYLWACHRLYNEFAWSYDAASWLVSAGHWTEWRRLALDYVDGSRVLELGFGTGELLLEMARRGQVGYGLDLSPAMQEITTGKLRRHAAEARRVRGLAQRLPFADGSFDSLVSTFPAEYIGDPATLRECARVLRGRAPGQSSGGRMVVVGLAIVVKNTTLRRLAPIFYGAPDASHFRRWTEALAAAGLRAHVLEHDAGGVMLPILIADKMS
jgi:ubiquinone/menaquinone biosynthesis C-methylase UbiE